MVRIEDNAVCVDLWRIISGNGYRTQKEKAIEELCELATELARDIQGDGDRDAITGEMADVYVVLAELLLIYGNQRDVEAVAGEKIRRTIERMDAGSAGGILTGGR